LLVLLALAGVLLVLGLAAILARDALRPPRHTAGYAIAHRMACDPGDAGLAFTEWTLNRPRDERLPVWEILTGTGGDVPPADRLTAVFVHGWGQSRVDMLARIEPWRPLVGRIVLYDLRGHGAAEGGPSRLGAGEEDDLLALLGELGLGRFLLVGHSMGAVIAINAAGRAAGGGARGAASGGGIVDRIAGVVAYGPYADLHRSLRGRLAAHGLPTRPITDLAMMWFRCRGIRPRFVVDSAAGLRCPLLVMHGGADDISPLRDGERIADAAPHGRINRVDGAGHRDVHLFDETAHAAEIARFVGEVNTRA